MTLIQKAADEAIEEFSALKLPCIAHVIYPNNNLRVQVVLEALNYS